VRDNSFDNDGTGYTQWMLQYLKGFLQNDFLEYNSRPYQTFSTWALQNLYDFAPGNVSVSLVWCSTISRPNLQFRATASGASRLIAGALAITTFNCLMVT